MVFAPFVASGKYIKYSLLPLCFYPHFNVTCFIKIGLSISFFEFYLLTFAFLVLIVKTKQRLLMTPIDKIFFLFLIISIISIVIAQLRIYIFQDLHPSIHLDETPIVRSLKSLNRLFVYPIPLMLIRNYFIQGKVDISFCIKKYLAYSAILPSIATLLQVLGVNFMLLFNNPSYSADLGWMIVTRPLGLTNEASFFAYMTFFSFIGVYYSQKDNIISKKRANALYCLYLLAVLVTISRTGMLVFLLFIILKNYNKLNWKKILVAILTLFVLSNVNILEFNLVDRFLSSFDFQADFSTIDRYGSAQAIATLALDKGLIWGIGIYNYMYYLYPYLPHYLQDAIPYGLKETIPSFNFVLQLLGEFGLPLLTYFILQTYFWLKRINHEKIIKDWFLYLGIFALSFQVLNFSLPFLILLYRPLYHENSICNRQT